MTLSCAHSDEPAIAITARPLSGATGPQVRPRPWLVRANVLGAGLAVGVFALLARDIFMDDAYIGFRCIENLLAGDGLVFNPAQRVEGVTNVGWLLALTPPAAWLGAPLAAKLLSGVCAIIALLLCAQVARRLSDGDNAEFLFLLPLPWLIVTHCDFALFANNGMETAFLAAGLGALAALALRRLYAPGTALLGALLFLVHPECILIYPLSLALVCGRSAGEWRRARAALAVFVGTIAVLELARFAYFGAWLPNTFVAKSSSAGVVVGQFVRWCAAKNVNIPFPFGGILVLLVLGQGAVSLRRRNAAAAAMLCTIVFVGLAFGCYSAPDWTALGRYFAPYVPVAFVLFWRGFVDLGTALLRPVATPRRSAQLVGLAAVAIAGVNVAWLGSVLWPPARATYPGYVLFAEGLVTPARELRATLPPEAVLATRRIGAAGYFSGHTIFDYTFGLAEPEVARLIRRNGIGFHLPTNPALADVWRRVRPDYLLEDENVIGEIAAAASGTPERFEIHGLTYRLVRTFPISTKMNWALCQREDTPAAPTQPAATPAPR